MRVISILLILLCRIILFAQVPDAIKYQAVARDETGKIMSDANITLRVSIVDSATTGDVVYSEIHNAQTNQNGLFTISIGRGIKSEGSFLNIDWSTGSKWMKLEIENKGTFVLIGASELLSVPYAMYADKCKHCGEAPLYDIPYRSRCFCFNPLYPDGTDKMIGVTTMISPTTSYVVPAGMNFHISTLGVVNIDAFINGIPVRSVSAVNYPFISMGAGDTILADSPTTIHGYLVKAQVTPINIDLNNKTYIIPNGKQLFITYCLSCWDILINGIRPNYLINSTPIILNSGDIISDTTSTNYPRHLNGYLK